jgi:hypothetical protein
MYIEQSDLLWLAGLLEGEGYFSSSNNNSSNIKIGIKMTDKDVMERVANILGVGVVYCKPEKSHWKPQYVVRLSNKRAKELMELLHPLMGLRRKAAIETALSSYKETDRSVNAYRAWDTRRKLYPPKSHCKHGHEYTTENTYISPKGGRFCKECNRMRGRGEL